MATKEYQREWRKNHPDECYKYRKKYEKEHKEYFININKIRNKKPRRKEYHKKYMREYSKRECEKKKKLIRLQTFRIYGKVQEGYERHHINYDSPHNFILLPMFEHRELHKNKNTTGGSA